MSASQQHPETAERGPDQGSSNPILAIGLFIRQVIAELKKVVVPTRTELIVYSITVLGFVFAMIILIFGLDYVFGALARIAFVAPDQ
ncbi:preprotein translocase subunit SecE [Brachybacterium hainanense]|uniref:Protein translocase subunit SecE n=1 Tax=Brachybacterium hainanense TaxID=1541174 RepID=A0ABV6RIL7_9MICO